MSAASVAQPRSVPSDRRSGCASPYRFLVPAFIPVIVEAPDPADRACLPRRVIGNVTPYKGMSAGDEHAFDGRWTRWVKVPKALGAEGFLAIVDHRRVSEDALLVRPPGVGLIGAA